MKLKEVNSDLQVSEGGFMRLLILGDYCGQLAVGSWQQLAVGSWQLAATNN
ncbi:MAG: hypothetical protein WBA89_15705 [Microcoleus sp.]|uniref:hypothetical protein n=1 Tax=Microcoleus sp. TaxID=44472 RepID=UPI003C71D545